MPTTVNALMFVPKARPQVAVAADGTFQLTMRLLDRLGPGRTEAWLAHWTGPEAMAWWNQHQAELQPGTPMRVQLTCPRIHFDRNARCPEIHARLQHIEFAPRHHSEDHHA